MRRRVLATAFAALAVFGLSSCDGPSEPSKGADAPPAAAASVYAASGDLSGYYMPLDPVRVGNWSLDHLFIGQAAEFQSWQGGERSATFGPVMLQFDDVNSPMVRTEIGEAHSITARVLPTSYTVNDAQVRFEGRSPELGRVIFDGRLDQGALATSRRNLGDEGVVLTGSLKVGDAPAQAVRLRWWMGD
ncbi:hypothetical protein [Brevundimonas lenta]|uniref:Lipid/polyisoprenoid-binding YceI-like domain-containing protein n=1 Tax=Brevundimonas lenta TaxID=424796 RepID=A0A7W6JDV0_9CAUL|nr:hypothetical protein [Brevundimonas lenta]MBB4083318.1 hypothetical protein [Brevundimonas lenta]